MRTHGGRRVTDGSAPTRWSRLTPPGIGPEARGARGPRPLTREAVNKSRAEDRRADRRQARSDGIEVRKPIWFEKPETTWRFRLGVSGGT
jgi:hypothetical protein